MGRGTRLLDHAPARRERAPAPAPRVDDLQLTELSDLGWAGSPVHLRAVAGELDRRDRGELDYLAVRGADGRAVAIGAVEWADDDDGYFFQLCTHPDQRRRGHMRALIAEGEQRIRGRGRAWATLSVEPANRAAISLYEQLGYELYDHGEASWEQAGPDGQPELYVCAVLHLRKRLRP